MSAKPTKGKNNEKNPTRKEEPAQTPEEKYNLEIIMELPNKLTTTMTAIISSDQRDDVLSFYCSLRHADCDVNNYDSPPNSIYLNIIMINPSGLKTAYGAHIPKEDKTKVVEFYVTLCS